MVYVLKRLCCVLLVFVLVLLSCAVASAAPPITFDVRSQSAILMDAATGMVMYEKKADVQLPIASITKIMSILLVFEALDRGDISWDDPVTVSREAAGTTGSQAFLDANSVYTVEELIRATIIASANDACVALAEHIAGSQAHFVERMNARAAELGLVNTLFVNCTGLPAAGHHSTAREVAMLSREAVKHEAYFRFSTTWLYDLVHPGGRVTTLTNTNRLVRFYEGADGIKTGLTTEAGHCLSASAKRGNLRLISVILGGPNSDVRFAEARALLEHGFNHYETVGIVPDGETVIEMPVARGKQKQVAGIVEQGYQQLLEKGEDANVEMNVNAPDFIYAPLEGGEKIGEIEFTRNGEVVAKRDIIAADGVEEMGYLDYVWSVLTQWKRQDGANGN